MTYIGREYCTSTQSEQEYILFTFMRYDSILMKVASVWYNCYTEIKEIIFTERETQEGEQ